MKIKYQFIGHKFLEENEQLEAFLKKQAHHGWMLEKIGMSFFKFRKIEPQNYQFFIDYNRPSDDYILSLKQYGYHFIDTYKMFNIFYSENPNMEPIQSDPIVKAIAHRDLYKPRSIILFFILGLFIYSIIDIFNLSHLIFRTFDHIILYLNSFLTYLLFKLLAVSLIFQALVMFIYRKKYNREIKGKQTPAFIFKLLKYINYLIDGLLIILCIAALITRAIDDLSIILTFILCIIIITIFNHFINKEIIKVDHKGKRILFTVGTFILLIGAFGIVSDSFSYYMIETSKPQAYESDIHNFSKATKTLFYDELYNYGTLDQKNEFDKYIQTYVETIYTCRNETIAKCIFRAFVRDCDYERRMPSEEEIDKIVEEKGEFDSYEDVPYYSYQKSMKGLKQYRFKNIEQCYGYQNNYIAIKDNIVYNVEVKDNTDLQKLFDFYQERK